MRIEPLRDVTEVYGVEFIRLPLLHGEMDIAGFRFGRAAYLTDVSTIPESSFALLEGLDCLIVSALRHKPHPSHATVEQAVGWARRIGARQTWFTHIAHELGHAATNRIAARRHGAGLRRTGIPCKPGICEPMNDRTSRSTSVYRSLAEIPADFGPSVAAIGNFDGLHLGHRQILTAVSAEAQTCGAKGVAITFDPHPEHFLRPAQAPKLLTPIDERLRLLAGTGVDAVLVLPFDGALAGLPARDFVRRVLVDALRVSSLHEGQSFRFGHRAEAGVKELAEFGAEFGFAVHLHEAVHVHGLEVSSSAVRELVAAGDMKRARWMLGRPFAVRSTPARGRGIGTRLLVPTVNLAPYDGLAAGLWRLCHAADGGWAVFSGRDKCGQPAHVWRGVVCRRVAHSGL